MAEEPVLLRINLVVHKLNLKQALYILSMKDTQELMKAAILSIKDTQELKETAILSIKDT